MRNQPDPNAALSTTQSYSRRSFGAFTAKAALLAATSGIPLSARKARAQNVGAKLDDAQVANIVKRSYQYVAMYNVNNKAAMDGTRFINRPSSRTPACMPLLDRIMTLCIRSPCLIYGMSQ